MAKRAPKTLYHYCGLETFYNILKNKSIWLSDISKSNDSRELRWVKGQYEFFSLKKWVEYCEQLEKVERLNEANFERFNRVKELSHVIYLTEMNKCWAFCLSEKHDNLAQWRGYADDGSGISIGFKAGIFFGLEILNQRQENNAQLFFRKIQYGQKAVERLFDDTGFSDISLDKSADENIDILDRAMSIALRAAPFYKDPGFEEEKEWRLAYSMDISDLAGGKIPQMDFADVGMPGMSIQKYGYTYRNHTLTSHVEFCADFFEDMINEIVIGPKCPVTTTEMQLFLISLGYLENMSDKKIKITKSSVSYQ